MVSSRVLSSEGFYSEENMGSWKKWILSLMPRSTQEDWAPLRSLLWKLMVSSMDIEFHPYEFLTLRLVCVIGRGVWRKSLMLSSAHPKVYQHYSTKELH